MFLQTHYSILNATGKVKDVLARVKELDYKVAIISDNNLFGTLEFYYQAKKEGIMPIISVRTVIEGVSFILLAKNENGYKNLSRMSKYEEPTLELLKEHSEDVVVIIDFDNLDAQALEKAKDYANFAGIKVVRTVEDKVKDSLIRSLNLPLVPVETAKYIHKEDYRNLIALQAIDGKTLYENGAIQKQQTEDYIKEKSYFLNTYPQEIKNLSKIIAECTDDYKFGNPTPPHFKFTKEVVAELGLSPDTTEEELFAHLSREGLKDRLQSIPEDQHAEYKARLEFEIDVINKMKFPGYMLIVWDFTKAAKDMNIPVGPGRGSAAGSLVAYALKITDLNPIPYGLLFERFLNPERVSMPDIDMDFCQSRRQEIIDYVANKYGKDSVAQIITFGQMGGKSVIRDSGRILSYPQALTDRMAKIIPETPGIKLKDAYEAEKAQIDAILNDSHAQRVWDMSLKLEGTKRNLGVHAAGLVISDEDITERCPKTFVGDTQVVQYEGKYLEDVNLIKFDFLGLKTLSVIDEAVKLIKQTTGKSINIDEIPMNDKRTFDYISTGSTKGMFQIESAGMQSLCKRLKPDCFEDLIAILALYRPGPMESGMLEDFIQRKRGEQKISYFYDDMTEALEPILKPTYGVIVYQEQVMQIVQEIGGFSLGESDIIRRAMGKKQIEYMNQKADEFSDRAEKKGFKKAEAKELFGLIEKFAGYGFNKSHSAAYALVTYQTAWLKTYYPVEFMTALMNFDLDKLDKLTPMIQEVQRMGITLHKPDINTSTATFSISNGEIVYGLKAIKGVGVDVENILENRVLGYDSLASFIQKNRASSPKMNKRVFTGLLFAGALDGLGSRGYMNQKTEEFMKITKAVDFEKLYHLTEEELFSNDLSLKEKIASEKEFLGHIISDPFGNHRKKLNSYEVSSFEDIEINGKGKIVAWIESKEVKTSKKGSKYAKLSVIDTNRVSRECLVFEKGLETFPSDISEPVILDISPKEDVVFVNGVQKLSEIGNFFAETADAKHKTDKQPTERRDINICDWKGLLEIENPSKLNIIDDKLNFVLRP
mgnify:CR=1 FL=1